MVDSADIFPRDENGFRATPMVGFDGSAWRYAGVDVDGLLATRNYVWDTGSLAWVKGTQAEGGGGGTVSVSNFPATYAATQSGTWTVQPGNTANTTAWKVDGSAVTQPVSGTFYQATQPVSIAATVAISAASLPLPSNAAIETGGNLATLVARLPVQGQAAMAASVPVALASNQSALAVTGTFYQATQPISAVSLPLPTSASQEHTTAGSPHATRLTDGSAFYKATTPSDTQPVSGTFWQATQPVSGTVTANQGTAGSADWRVDMRRGQTVLFAAIDVAASGDNTIVAADGTKKIKVLSYAIVADAAVSARWKSGATSLTGAMSLAANGGIASPLASPAQGHILETAVNNALILNLSGAIGARGHISYFLEA